MIFNYKYLNKIFKFKELKYVIVNNFKIYICK